MNCGNHCDCIAFKDVGNRMNQPGDLNEIIEAANKVGAAVMLLDADNRILFVNEHLRNIYRTTDFNTPQTYESFFWDGVKHRVLNDSDIYHDPASWLAQALHFKKTTPFAQYMVNHNDGKAYMARHQILPGLGSIFVRLEVPRRELFSSPRVVPLGDQKENLGGGLFSFTNSYERGVAKALISKLGIVVDANRMFVNLINSCDGISLVNRRMVLSDGTEGRKFYETVVGVSSGENPRGSLMRITRKTFGKFYICNISAPTSNSWRNDYKISGFALVSMVDSCEDCQLESRHLEEAFGLTPSEARVAIGLASGRDISEVALRHGVSVGTARNQLKGVFQKLGINKQIELVRIVMRISAICQ